MVGLFRHGLIPLAAGLSFYVVLSIAPVVLLLLFLAGYVGDEWQTKMVEHMRHFAGPWVGEALGDLIERAREATRGQAFAGTLGALILALALAGVTAQLQVAFNAVWGVEAQMRAQPAAWLRKRLLSLGLVIGAGLVGLAALFLDAALNAVTDLALDHTWHAVVSMVAALGVFTALFRVMPDADVRWREGFVGAAITAVLLTAGRFGVGWLVGESRMMSVYGAASSIVLLLLWVYYCTIMVFLGAELTRAYAEHARGRAAPEPPAIRARAGARA